MKETNIVQKVREIIINMGPVKIRDLHELDPRVFKEHSEREVESIMKSSKFLNQDDTGRWVLTGETADYGDNYFPPDIEPLDSDHQFYKDLADLVDEYTVEEEGKYKWWCACIAYGAYWKSDPGGY